MKDKAERTKNINEKLLQVLEPEEKKKLGLNVKGGNFKKGDAIVKEDEYDDILYYLENRVCKTKKRVEIGKKEVSGKDIKKDDSIGVDYFLKGKLRDETVIAWSDDVKVVGLSLDEFVDVEDLWEIFAEYYPEIKKREEERLERERIEREKKEKKEEEKIEEEKKEENKIISKSTIKKVEEKKWWLIKLMKINKMIMKNKFILI